MRVVVFVKATADSEAGAMPTPELIEAMGKFNEALVDAGVMISGDGLTPTSQGKRIAFDGLGRTVIDGPFAETKEVVAGYWVWEVKDMADAVEWVKRCPNPMPGEEGVLEIRPTYTTDDLADFIPAEEMKRELQLRRQLTRAAKGKGGAKSKARTKAKSRSKPRSKQKRRPAARKPARARPKK